MHPPQARAHTARLEFHRRTGKIHPRAVAGRYNRARWALVWLTQLVFYAGCWLEWNGRQALLFDIAERKFHLFGLVLWPQDALLLALLLMIAATGLFLVTALAGRLFCGFACPQTVYTAMFRWIEARIEGDHLARMRLDQAPAGPAKLARKGLKHLVWLALAAWTGLTFVGYFTPIRELLPALAHGDGGPWECFWVGFYALFTYLQAGFAREMVCLHMCPYARFQGVMFDPHTRGIAYDRQRGEPRRARGAAAGGARGDCVDCGLCVQVCPTGIDIRDGLQYQCINCGLCADACDEVMRHTARPIGLVRFASEHELGGAPATTGSLRPRALAYSALLLVLMSLGGWQLAARVPIQLDILRERHALLRETADGAIENGYALKLGNMLEQPRTFRVAVEGLADARLIGPQRVEVAAGSVATLPVTLVAQPNAQRSGPQALRFVVSAEDDPTARVAGRTVFMLP